MLVIVFFFFFFFNDPAPTEIYTLSLHDALPIYLRQVSYALFCTTDEHLPLFYDVYEGNRNDAKQFPQVLEKFQRWLKERAGSTWTATKPTLIFDKGNRSEEHTSELQSQSNLVCRLLLEKKKQI